ncbi:hypothetical protein ES689_09190 [Frigoribacterium sp. ACAM 257]|uniref:hypothetical protein n=1 Tax=Frigoribacterium sp. ACAM 257 TaxID=2508998 RepID=UPI0011B9DF75|nr:hypothetical protein [Frigoribacterium sp. ACAM 257]TWX38774.1 hypothetical protein ES689_09190 [Frigoribacterium sp. ACAM 257]
MTLTISTTRSRRAVATAASGALALALLLTGCTGGGDSDDEASQSATGSSGSGSSAAAGDGEPGTMVAFGSCEAVGETLGSAIEGLELRDESTATDEGFQCSWASSTEDTEDASAVQAVIAVAQVQEFDADTIAEQADTVAATEGVTAVDDSRAADLDGRAFTQTGESTGILVNGGTVITTHGLFNVTATATTETSLDAEQALDAAFSLIN